MRVPVVIRRRAFMIPSWAAAQVPCRRTIWIKKGVRLTEGLLAHELCHVVQAENHSWPLAYFKQWALTGFSYTDMPFEVAARKAATEPFYRAWAADLLAENPNL